MLSGLHRGGQHARVLERRRGDNDRVHVGGQQLLEILIDGRLLDLDLGYGGFDAIVEQIADRGDAGPGIGVDERRVVGSPVAGSYQANRNGGVGVRATHCSGAYEGKGSHAGGTGRAQHIPPRNPRLVAARHYLLAGRGAGSMFLHSASSNCRISRPKQPLSYVRGVAKSSNSNRAPNVRERLPPQTYTLRFRTHATGTDRAIRLRYRPLGTQSSTRACDARMAKLSIPNEFERI